jgi:hypothetical protein
MHFPQSKLFQPLLGVLCNSDQKGTKCENYMKDGLNGEGREKMFNHPLQTLWVLVLHLSSLYHSEYIGEVFTIVVLHGLQKKLYCRSNLIPQQSSGRLSTYLPIAQFHPLNN